MLEFLKLDLLVILIRLLVYLWDCLVLGLRHILMLKYRRLFLGIASNLLLDGLIKPNRARTRNLVIIFHRYRARWSPRGVTLAMMHLKRLQ